MTEGNGESKPTEAVVHAPSWVARNLNIPTIVGVIGLMLAGGGAFVTSISNYNEMRFRLDAIESSRKAGRDEWTERMRAIEAKLEDQKNVPYRLTVVEQQLVAQNQRMDRAYETFMAALEVIRKDINAVGTKVEVLSQKIDNLSPQAPRRTGVERRADIDTAK